MALCTGERKVNHLQCNGTLYQCECGATGCKQKYDDDCSAQGFDVKGKCLKCGAVGKYTSISSVTTDHAPRKTPAFL
jgi:hypothetical protein